MLSRDLFLSYNCSTCKFKGRNNGVFSLFHDADVTKVHFLSRACSWILFLIRADSLCLLIVVFVLFTFSVVTDVGFGSFICCFLFVSFLFLCSEFSQGTNFTILLCIFALDNLKFKKI